MILSNVTAQDRRATSVPGTGRESDVPTHLCCRTVSSGPVARIR
jgi:hypothetical protein